MQPRLVVLATYLNPPDGKVAISYLDGDLPPAPFRITSVVKAAQTQVSRLVTIHCGLNILGQPFAYAAPPKDGVCVGCVAQTLINLQGEIWRSIQAKTPFMSKTGLTSPL